MKRPVAVLRLPRGGPFGHGLDGIHEVVHHIGMAERKKALRGSAKGWERKIRRYLLSHFWHYHRL